MAKKCPPGVLCIENMTIVLLILILCLMGYILYIHTLRITQTTNKENSTVIIAPPNVSNDILGDPYKPPLKNNGYFHTPDSGDVRGIPVNIETRGTGMDYQQVGILTRTGNSDIILPLMGRRLMSGRDNWQYYTLSNTGNISTKLPVSVNGKSCTGEYGCDIIYNSDVVYVEGYNDTFNATIYENNLFRYLPSQI